MRVVLLDDRVEELPKTLIALLTRCVDANLRVLVFDAGEDAEVEGGAGCTLLPSILLPNVPGQVPREQRGALFVEEFVEIS